MEDNRTESFYTVVANIVTERLYGPGGNEKKLGTNLFPPRTKVYIIDWFAGMCTKVTAIGLSRKPKRYIKTVIRVDMIENLRVKICYEPKVIALIKSHYNTEHDSVDRLTKTFAQTMCNEIPVWQKNL